MSPLRLHSSALADGPGPNADVQRGPSADARPPTREVTAVPLDVETIYREHADDVARWARRLGGPDIDVEDIVHEVFLVVQRRLAEWRGDARITTWLYEITFRVVRDRRARWRWRRWSGRAAGRESTATGADLAELPSDQPDALDLLQRREATAALYAILDGIGEKYRTVIILFELEGKSGQEIAALTETSLSNVWIRLYRAREKVLKRFSAWEAKERR
jgi:RNA polymerase sigma-70 factor (ECF subfamily)